MDSNYSLSDLAAVTNGADGLGGSGGGVWLILLFLFLLGGNGGFGVGGNREDAVSYEILSNQHFNALSTQMSNLANGLCDSTYALSNAITGEGRALQTQIADCCCATQLMGRDIITNMNDGFQRIIDNQNSLEMQHMREENMRNYISSQLCGVVRYPNATTYTAGGNPFYGGGCGGCGCGAGF